MDTYDLVLSHLKSAVDLAPSRLVVSVEDQLRRQGRRRSNRYRYALEIAIIEGCARPASDLDNYAKPVIDSVTRSGLLWRDDSQIDELVIRRQRDGNSADSFVTVTLRRIGGQHRGVPSHFRARCHEASQGVISYSDVGYYLAKCLLSEVPNDLKEEEWTERVERLINMLDAEEENNAWNWFRDHLPRFMELIPGRRKSQFLDGVHRAHEEGHIGE